MFNEIMQTFENIPAFTGAIITFIISFLFFHLLMFLARIYDKIEHKGKPTMENSETIDRLWVFMSFLLSILVFVSGSKIILFLILIGLLIFLVNSIQILWLLLTINNTDEQKEKQRKAYTWLVWTIFILILGYYYGSNYGNNAHRIEALERTILEQEEEIERLQKKNIDLGVKLLERPTVMRNGTNNYCRPCKYYW